MSEQQVVEQIRDTAQPWVDGKVSATEFEAFLKSSNAQLDELKAAKAAEQERWFRMF